MFLPTEYFFFKICAFFIQSDCWASTCPSVYQLMQEKLSPSHTHTHTARLPVSSSGGGGESKASQAAVHSHFHASFQLLTQTPTAMITSDVFSCFVFYGALMVLKMYAVAIITGQVRLRKKVRVCEAGRTAETTLVITSEKWCNISSPEGFCEPGGLCETRRIAVPQRGPICGEMPQVQEHFHRRLALFISIINKQKCTLRVRKRPVLTCSNTCVSNVASG